MASDDSAGFSISPERNDRERGRVSRTGGPLRSSARIISRDRRRLSSAFARNYVDPNFLLTGITVPAAFPAGNLSRRTAAEMRDHTNRCREELSRAVDDARMNVTRSLAAQLAAYASLFVNARRSAVDLQSLHFSSSWRNQCQRVAPRNNERAIKEAARVRPRNARFQTLALARQKA